MSFKAKIEKIEGDRVTILLENGQSFSIDRSAIEGTPLQGSEVAVVVASLGGEQAGRQQLAQDLLNELLKG